jgi:16S rRNA A1518/A1519 N6-dimethyltransferase RsmA/KsgA/DIM1 with predicted DNA glycosylase/AP lyase activity
MPNKLLGQHFLKNKEVIQKIVRDRADARRDDH